jgi:glyoxylase-like metal-dependent hydrolase (beta-lactamase superfamily II)
MTSGCDRTFNDPERHPESSLCRTIGMATPKLDIIYMADDGETVKWEDVCLRLLILQTPGHKPPQ